MDNLRAELHRLVDGIDDDTTKSELHQVIDVLEDHLLPAAMTYIKELRRVLDESAGTDTLAVIVTTLIGVGVGLAHIADQL